jgi:nicotinate-nucleotide adenylyltransferase
MRLGILGGTFDPPHVGHFLGAVDALERLPLDRMVVVPAATQPLKADRETAPAADRLAMARLAFGDDPRFEVDPIEMERPGLSYTVDTLTAFADRHAGSELFFVTGADVVRTFGKWREPERVARLAQLVVLARTGAGSGEGSGEDAAGRRALEAHGARFLASRRVDVSSTEVRARVRAGKSIRGFVPDAVAAYIVRAGLYR